MTFVRDNAGTWFCFSGQWLQKSPFPWGSLPPCGSWWYCTCLSKSPTSIWKISRRTKGFSEPKPRERLKHSTKLLKIILSRNPSKSHSQSSLSSKINLQLAVIWCKMPVPLRVPLSEIDSLQGRPVYQQRRKLGAHPGLFFLFIH